MVCTVQFVVMKEKSKWERQECMTDTNVVERWHARWGGGVCMDVWTCRKEGEATHMRKRAEGESGIQVS